MIGRQLHQVFLRDTRFPQFPPLCVACGAPSPEILLVWKLRQPGRYEWLLPYVLSPLFREPREFHVPACASCRPLLLSDRRGDRWVGALRGPLSIVIGFIGSVIVLSRGWLPPTDRASVKFQYTLVSLIVAAPLYFGASWIFRRSIRFRITQQLVFEFRNPDVARAFREWNAARSDRASV
jgi:hypothetical protein